MSRVKLFTKFGALFLLTGFLVVSCSPVNSATLEPRPVAVQLFQWSWNAVAKECREVLPEIGINQVVVSPAQEHILGQQWWTAYQPVSYQLESRLGTQEELEAMLDSCADSGVAVIADAVINHMSGQSDGGIGWAGTEYQHFEYPGLYSDAAGDFHHCGRPPDDLIRNYKDAFEVQYCQLVNLADLNTASASVQKKISDYLIRLSELGFAGARIDAAKHIPSEDLAAIAQTLPKNFLLWQEVIRGAGEAVTPEEYLAIGSIYEFGFARELSKIVRNNNYPLLRDIGPAWGFVPSDQALSFVENHDTERNGETLNYRSPNYLLGYFALLNSDYGLPVLYSGYAFSEFDEGPPQDASGRVLEANCQPETSSIKALAETEAGSWLCQHSRVEIQALVAWYKSVAGTETVEQNWDKKVYALSRADLGFAALNVSGTLQKGSWKTGLAPGRYCELISSNWNFAQLSRAKTEGVSNCSGVIIEVSSNQELRAEIAAKDLILISKYSKLGG